MLCQIKGLVSIQMMDDDPVGIMGISDIVLDLSRDETAPYSEEDPGPNGIVSFARLILLDPHRAWKSRSPRSAPSQMTWTQMPLQSRLIAQIFLLLITSLCLMESRADCKH